MGLPSTAAADGSAQRWGPLWGARPADWALSEDQQVPTYEAALRRVDLRHGQLVLDVGCGVGSFLQVVAERGARLAGVDASEELLDVARARLPDADLRVGDMEALPYADDTFDLVAGFNSFFFANDIVAALDAYGSGALGGQVIPLAEVDRVIAIGSDGMMSAVAKARQGMLARHFKPGHKAIAFSGLFHLQ